MAEIDEFHDISISLQQLRDTATDLMQSAEAALASPWFYIQIAIVIASVAAAHGAAKLIRRRTNLDDLAASWPVAARLVIHTLVDNLGTAILVVILFAIRRGMMSATWPSRSYAIAVALSLATAWILIRLVTSTIRNEAAVRIVSLAAWFVAALSILGLLGPTLTMLDSVAVVVGGLRISPLFAIEITALLVFALWVANLAGNFFESRVYNINVLTPSVQVLIAKLLRLLTIVLAFVLVMGAVGIDLSAFALFSGAIGVGLGFGLQKIVANFVSGIILLADKSVKPGDLITVGDSFGRVNAMNTRYISIAAIDGREFLVPNEDMVTQKVVNWTYSDKRTMLHVDFGVSYASDPHRVCALATDVCANVARILRHKPPVCHFTEFGDSSLNFRLYFWIEDPEEGLGNVRSQVLLALWSAFKREGIEIPFPVRDVRLRVEHGASPAGLDGPLLGA